MTSLCRPESERLGAGPVILGARTACAIRGYCYAMSKWPKDWRPQSPDDARTYLDAHENGGGDAELIEECERLVDAITPGGTVKSSPFPKPSDDQMEEKGSD